MLLTAVKAKFYSFNGQFLLDYSDQDKVFINAEHLPEFGIPKLNDESKRPVLTITINGKKIHRQFKQGSSYGIKRGEVAFLDRDSRYLEIKGENEIVDVKKSNLIGHIKYYLNNPRQELRVSIIFGIITTSVSIAYDIAKDLFFK
jgi:hypothetical protein